MSINNLILKKLSKQEPRQNYEYRERFDGFQMGGVCGTISKEVRGIRSTNRQLQNNHGAVKYCIENGVAKEFISKNMDMNNGRGIA